MIPFILGLEDVANRTVMSWDYDDIFQWVAYENEMLDIP